MGRRHIKTPVIALAAVGLLVSTAWAQRTYTRSDGQSDTRMQQSRTQSRPQQQVSGTVLRSKDVQIRQQGQETEHSNHVILLETQQGERLVVDLGPRQQLQDLNLQQGMQLQAQGQIARIGDRPVLFASQINAQGRSFQIQRSEQRQPRQRAAQRQRAEPSQPQQVTGQIKRVKDVELRGTDRTHKVALLATDQGRQFVVDLGPIRQLQNVRLQQGAQLQVQGRPARIGDRLVLLANQITVNDQTVQITRPQQPTTAQQATGQFHAQAPSMINVTAAGNILGRNVVDRQGGEAGDVDYLIIDMQSGKVRYALIGEGGFLGMGEDLLPVPWSALEYSPQTLRLTKSMAELRNAPRYSARQILELTDPTVERMIIDYYLTPQRQAQQGTQQPQDQGQQARQGQQEARQQTQTQQGGQQQSAAVRPYVLVDRDFVSLFTQPAFTRAEEIRGAEVVGPTGAEVGEIDEIIIDPDHGYVAYVLLERGGFLGFGEEWIPVPFGAFQVSGENFQLSRAEEQLRRMPKLPRQELPAQVSAEHLRQLYAEYNVTPYWERAVQTAKRSSAGSGAGAAGMVATVQELNPQQGTLTLQTASGRTVDLQVSKELVSNLEAGDKVHITIRRTPEGQQSRTPRTAPERER